VLLQSVLEEGADLGLARMHVGLTSERFHVHCVILEQSNQFIQPAGPSLHCGQVSFDR
jgi:hypothetical protein